GEALQLSELRREHQLVDGRAVESNGQRSALLTSPEPDSDSTVRSGWPASPERSAMGVTLSRAARTRPRGTRFAPSRPPGRGAGGPRGPAAARSPRWPAGSGAATGGVGADGSTREVCSSDESRRRPDSEPGPRRAEVVRPEAIWMAFDARTDTAAAVGSTG